MIPSDKQGVEIADEIEGDLDGHRDHKTGQNQEAKWVDKILAPRDWSPGQIELLRNKKKEKSVTL